MITVIFVLTLLQQPTTPVVAQDASGEASVRIMMAARVTAESFELAPRKQRTYRIGREGGQLVEYRLVEFE